MGKREQTEQRILDTFEDILVNEGFQQLKINYVAAKAKVDKVLIYRYFGGLEQLAEKYAESGEFWPTVEESIGQLTLEDFQNDFENAVATLIHQHIQSIRTRKATAAILAWELIESSPAGNVLAKAREAHVQALFSFLLKTGRFDSEFLNAFGAIFGASLNYLIIRSGSESVFAGIPVQTDAGWDMLEAMYTRMALSMLQPH
ncbi:hypothetical protein VA7868_03779 [Vibrio aerogenes CECT 7868]|uniref:HTH tetR-type domain-containing protein n=1 Tax=Vibrio aerogenes CECT 7868 TaxID=1216006 RepID=A0A1M6BET3_9VIBR|nr:TetR/AcrR family transcriptional regulator [Vibrio aerogenes]SHI47252.1 hypothetical protein VA7868_03779 [Vibrio aerogenes CECT 7868]